MEKPPCDPLQVKVQIVPKLPVQWPEYTRGTNLHFICEHCFKHFRTKKILISHISKCRPGKNLMCNVCNVKFTNKGNLARHATVHSIQGVGRCVKDNTFLCTACNVSFPENGTLTQHIRIKHFNLAQETYTHTTKSVNEVWVEKVINRDIMIEMKKVKKNVIVMKKCDPISSEELEKITDHKADQKSSYLALKKCDSPIAEEPKQMSEDEADLQSSDMPTDKKKMVRSKCKLCNKWMLRSSLKLHIKEIHRKFKLHNCTKCEFQCKRPSQLMKHVCGPNGRKRGKRKVLQTG